MSASQTLVSSWAALPAQPCPCCYLSLLVVCYAIHPAANTNSVVPLHLCTFVGRAGLARAASRAQMPSGKTAALRPSCAGPVLDGRWSSILAVAVMPDLASFARQSGQSGLSDLAPRFGCSLSMTQFTPADPLSLAVLFVCFLLSAAASPCTVFSPFRTSLLLPPHLQPWPRSLPTTMLRRRKASS